MNKHKHDHKQITRQVLLARYAAEDGAMKYQGTTGKDILKQFKCKCGDTLTYDLERVKR